MCLCVCLEGREKEREKAVSNSITDSDGDLCVRTCLVEPGIQPDPRKPSVGVGGGERVVCSVLSHPVSLAQVDVSDADDTCSSLMSPPSSKAPPLACSHLKFKALLRKGVFTS